mmetsp:Transcript_25763/g.47084  ORF Transcript_25763/g.47084 Transcript_25763/m.47084 type:complete len:373 (-) Transcript_25763:31-1149(-)
MMRHLFLASICSTWVLAAESVQAQVFSTGKASLRSQTSAPQVKVWIDAFGRSGSSTLLSMVEAVESPNLTVLGLFEPTHDWPVGNMDTNFLKLMQCDTAGLPELYGLSDAHSTTSGSMDKEALAQTCKAADLLAVKTINLAHNLTAEVLPLLEQDKDLKVLYLVRDPRGILASQQETPGSFEYTSEQSMLDVCNVFWNAALVDHPRVMRVVFEEMVSAPEPTARAIYRFLGLPEVAEAQRLWIEANFDATQCVTPWRKLFEYVIWMFGGSISAFEAYDDCRADDEDTADKWRSALSEANLKAFESHPACRQAADFYNWPRGVIKPGLAAKQYSRVTLWLMVIGFLALICLPGAIFYSWCCRKSVQRNTDATP